MLKETNINNSDKKTKLFFIPKKKDIITSAHIDGNWGDIVIQYKDGKTVNYIEEIDSNDLKKSDTLHENKEAA